MNVEIIILLIYSVLDCQNAIGIFGKQAIHLRTNKLKSVSYYRSLPPSTYDGIEKLQYSTEM